MSDGLMPIEDSLLMFQYGTPKEGRRVFFIFFIFFASLAYISHFPTDRLLPCVTPCVTPHPRLLAKKLDLYNASQPPL
jgi:hypothetical protein